MTGYPCRDCNRDNCRVAYWDTVVAELVAHGKSSREAGIDLEDAQRARDAAKVSCFIRAGQRARYPR